MGKLHSAVVAFSFQRVAVNQMSKKIPGGQWPVGDLFIELL
jgi:hypothetical protein